MKLFFKLSVLSSALACAAVQAGGLYLYEDTTTNVALASAGSAARADDASVLSANPAGLAHVSGQSFSGSLVGLYGDATLDTATGDAGNVLGFTPMGSMYYSQQLNDQWTWGLGLYGTYGNGVGFDDLPVVGYSINVPNALTQAMTFQPSVAYRVNEQLSLGLGLGIQYGMFAVEADNSVIEKSVDIDDQDVAINAHIGLLYEFSPQTRLGVAYSSEAELEFENDVIGSVMPQQLTVSAYHELNQQWAVMGNVNWNDWSSYNSLAGVDLQDTYQLAVGAQYQVNEKMTWNMGVAFDTSMYESQSQGDFTVPTGDSYRFGTGLDYQLDASQTVSVAFEAVLIESSQGELFGLPVGYEDPALYFLSFGYSWKN